MFIYVVIFFLFFTRTICNMLYYGPTIHDFDYDLNRISRELALKLSITAHCSKLKMQYLLSKTHFTNNFSTCFTRLIYFQFKFNSIPRIEFTTFQFDASFIHNFFFVYFIVNGVRCNETFICSLEIVLITMISVNNIQCDDN